MDGNQDESDASRPVKDDSQGLGDAALAQDKKDAYWMGDVMGCFSTVMSLFTRADLKPSKEDDWEVPYTSLTSLTYLGSGAQGVVFSGHFRGEMVAVKQLGDCTETNIKHLRKLNHENIVRFRGVCTVPPYCVIMEFCQYGPLFEFLHSGACFAPKQIMNWAKQIANGMTYLHSNRIIHRDLKSPNILIADDLVAKVSDFGTSREWNDVSAVMSFTGTVAWMAPEMIRHEPCSERVDVWSYGVVLWELLTQEVPYKDLETHAIMWCVGTNTISLPVPAKCPNSLQQLLGQCWNRVPKNRPPFKIIAAHLEIIGDELSSYKVDCFSATQAAWRKEVKEGMDKFFIRSEEPAGQEAIMQRREEIKHARDLRQVYESQVLLANELYLEASAVKLQLEQRERDVAEREKAIKACRCLHRKSIKYHRQTSSSSDSVRAGILAKESRRKKKDPVPAQIVVNYLDKPQAQTHSVAVKDGLEPAFECDDSVENNNITTVVEKKETIIEKNGNVDVKTKHVNDNFKSNIAHV